nr:MAG TPA: hypothetical protein [Caudoviricetes sp.]
MKNSSNLHTFLKERFFPFLPHLLCFFPMVSTSLLNLYI